jgi:hypothetical protein
MAHRGHDERQPTAGDCVFFDGGVLAGQVDTTPHTVDGFKG